MLMAYGLASREQIHRRELEIERERQREREGDETIKALLNAQVDPAMLVDPEGVVLA